MKAATADEMVDLDKPLYSVSVASEILSSDPGTLMMYEGLGLAVPQRTRANHRRYTSRDMLGLHALHRLMGSHGLNLAGARYVIRYLQLLDAQRIQRPLELASIHVEHVRMRRQGQGLPLGWAPQADLSSPRDRCSAPPWWTVAPAWYRP